MGKVPNFPDTLQTAIMTGCAVCVNREICSREVYPVPGQTMHKIKLPLVAV